MASPFSTANTAAGLASAADTRAPARGFARGGNDDWKAQAFLNLYLPGADGQPKKLGTIALKDSVEDQSAIIEMLKADPEALKRLVAALTVTFQPVVARETGFKF